MPASALRTFTDPDAYFSGIRNLRIDGVVTGRGQFRAQTTRIDLHRLFMHCFDENLPRIMRVTPSGMRAGILFATGPEPSAMQVNSVETSHDQIASVGLHSDWYLRSATATQWNTMSLTPEDLGTASRSIVGRELVPPTFTGAIAPPATLLSRLRSLHDAAVSLAKTAPDILAKPEVARAIEEALVEAMVLCLAAGRPDRVRNVQRQRAKVMRRFEEALTARPEEPLYIAELCAEVGASYWTLRASCREYLGMSPKRYLWLRRMQLVRRALCNADPGRTTVTEIATNFGFWELGRFSVAFRSLFDESPSAALRRAPGNLGVGGQATS
jgi:AraC-like DNA-binding protein